MEGGRYNNELYHMGKERPKAVNFYIREYDCFCHILE